jgi:hypothetical protein
LPAELVAGDNPTVGNQIKGSAERHTASLPDLDVTLPVGLPLRQ